MWLRPPMHHAAAEGRMPYRRTAREEPPGDCLHSELHAGVVCQSQYSFLLQLPAGRSTLDSRCVQCDAATAVYE